MGKNRGRERLERCSSCGRVVPRDKAVEYTRKTTFSTDLKGEDNVTYSDFRSSYYCISCAKHRKIFEKLKQQNQRRKERELYG
jgi:ribosomal protein S26